MKSEPAAKVTEWVATQPASGLFITAITKAEILFGIALLPKGRRRSGIASAARAMFDEDFSDRILAFNSDAAVAYADIAFDRRTAGRPISQPDAQIAAITRTTGAALATRNVGDFDDCGIKVINPWKP